MKIKKGMYVINGVEKMIVADLDEKVSDVLRRIGLTSVKIGCGTGQCGACTVLMDGKPIRSCIKKWKNVPEHTSFETVEGIGISSNLHPLQLAWIKYGGVQCGYCTPGFIMSAKGLLDVNPAPTRQEVREWFTKNNNLCRCTGYKQLVDAVMAAAEVIRGEKPIESLNIEIEDGHVYNSWAPRPTAMAKVMGVCDYGKDISDKMPSGTLQLAVTWSEHAHANILSIDATEAEKMPGVVAVLTHKDVKGTNNIGYSHGHLRSLAPNPFIPVLAVDKVMRIGDAVAIVVADTEENARSAAKAVKVRYEVLPTYNSVLESCVPGAVSINQGIPNSLCDQPLLKGEDTRPIIEEGETQEKSDVAVVGGAFYATRQPHLAIEGMFAQSYYDENDRLCVAYKGQNIHFMEDLVADAVGVPVEQFRFIMNPAGGSFGYSMTPDIPALAAVACMATGQPVAINFTYAEAQRYSGKRSACYGNGKLAVNKNTGKIEAVQAHYMIDTGAYVWQGPDLAQRMCSFIGYPYSIPNIRALVQVGVSNQPFGTAYRGWGSPQAYTLAESLVDMAARKIGMDPFEFRYEQMYKKNQSTGNRTSLCGKC